MARSLLATILCTLVVLGSCWIHTAVQTVESLGAKSHVMILRKFAHECARQSHRLDASPVCCAAPAFACYRTWLRACGIDI